MRLWGMRVLGVTATSALAAPMIRAALAGWPRLAATAASAFKIIATTIGLSISWARASASR